MKIDAQSQILLDIAHFAMLSHGLEPKFSEDVIQHLKGISKPADVGNETLPDLTHLLWCSIDNDDSMDLDQITVAEKLSDGRVKLCVAVADVEAVVKIGDPIDQHAEKNTTSVYTGVKIFPMLPEKLSTNLTSFSEGENRLAFIIEMIFNKNGDLEESNVYSALVRNQAKLAYSSVGAWLEGLAPLPEVVHRIKGMDEQLKMQDELAQKMKLLRYKQGALELETIEPKAVIKEGLVFELKQERKNRAHALIEEFMIAANGVTARYLSHAGYPSLRRVVRSPERWERIVEVALDLGEKLPFNPNSKALSDFLSRRRVADPLRFPDLSLTIVKLLGRGEYILEMPNQNALGHFGLAVQDYTHSTAPNRRFPDLITQRMLKAAFNKGALPYTPDELAALASHCTLQEDAANKVERHLRKSAAALFLSSRIGAQFDAIVTGVSDQGAWARVISPPVEGKLVRNANKLKVGNKIRVKLLSVDVDHGFIDFKKMDH